MKKYRVEETELDNTLYNYLEALLSEVPDVEDQYEESIIVDPALITEVADINNEVELSDSETEIIDVRGEENSALASSVIFKALLFKVGDMTMLAPMAELRGVSPWPDMLTKITGDRSSSLGLARRNGVNLNVLDTCYLLDQMDVGNNCHEEVADYLNMILIGDGTTALACHNVIDIVDVEPKKIRWRKTRKSRPWYLGVDTKRMGIMLDVSEVLSAANDS